MKSCRCWEAQNRGYISVGLHVDSEDWQRPGVPTIVNNVLTQGSDGVRPTATTSPTNSAAATSSCFTIPAAIAARRSPRCRSSSIRCARAATASCRCPSLAGLSPNQAMPPLSSSDQLAARTDLAVFELLSFGINALGYPVRGGHHARHRPRAPAHRASPGLRLEGGEEAAAGDRSGHVRQRPHPGVQRRAGDRAVDQSRARQRAGEAAKSSSSTTDRRTARPRSSSGPSARTRACT